MPYRTFTDSLGVEWTAWDVIPQEVDRRIADRRMVAEPVEEERRHAPRRADGPRVSTSTTLMQQGWICFEARQERRRLMRIPDGWAAGTDAELEALVNTAKPVPQFAIRYDPEGRPARSPDGRTVVD